MRKFLTLVDPVVPMHHPYVLVEMVVGYGFDQWEVLEGTGITPAMLGNPDARVSYAQFGSLVGRAFKLTGNPALGVELGRRIHICHLGMLGVALMNSGRAGEALRLVIRYSRALAPAWDLSLHVGPEQAELHVGEELDFGPYRVFAIESMLVAICSQARFLLGGPPTGLRVWLPYDEPAYAQEYLPFFGDAIHYDSDRVALACDSALLECSIGFADPITLQLAERKCAELVAQLPTGEGLLPQVRRILEASPDACPDIDDMARQLRTSSRSLRRALQGIGTSYQQLVDEVRQAQALRLMAGTHMTVEQVAERLGFAGARSFRRAFKRWTGRTPQAYRAETHA